MDRKTDLRLWAVLFWLVVWQLAAMALRAAYPHGELLLASPVNVLLRLGQLAVTAAFWRTVASPRCWRSRWRHWRRGNSGSGG